MTDKLTEEQIKELREKIAADARGLVGIPYEFGAEWVDHQQLPRTLDCSELVEGVFFRSKLQPLMPDGSQNQFNFTVPVALPRPGDLAFFGRGSNPHQIYHVGLVYNNTSIIEARAKDPSAMFTTGCVILRPLEKWKAYKNFAGFRSHPKLV